MGKGKTEPIAAAMDVTAAPAVELVDELQAGDQLPELEAEPARLEPPPVPETGRVVPEGFDLFAPRPDAVAKVAERGLNPKLRKVRVYPINGGKRGPMLTELTADGLTLAWFRGHIPPGVYDLQGLTEDRMWLGGERVVVNETDSGAFAQPKGAASSSGGLADEVMRALVMRALDKENGSGFESAMSGMVKAMSAQQQMLSTAVQLQLQAMQAANAPAQARESSTMEMLKVFLPLLRPPPAPASPPRAPAAAGSTADLLTLLKFGMELGKGKGQGNGDAPPAWFDMLPDLVDSVGPGILVVLAQLFPEDKAKQAMELMEQHMRAREAEAKARASEAETDPIETEGQTVQ